MRPLAFLAVAFAVLGLSFAPKANAQPDLTIVTWGGSTTIGEMNAWFKPIARELNFRIREDFIKTPNDLHAYAGAGRTDWDVVVAASDMCERGGRAGLLEELDYSVIDTTGVIKEQLTPWSVPASAFTIVLAYNKKKYKDNPPTGWKDFFDVKRFPGTRFFGPFANSTLEIALLADGVPADKLYPLDVERAFAKLQSFKPHVTAFISSYGQAVQAMLDGEADMLFLPDARVFAAQQAGADYGLTFNQGLMNFNCLVVPKGTKRKPLAMQVIAKVMTPEINGRISEALGTSPGNRLAIERGVVPPALASTLAMSPANFKNIILMNNKWWAENREKLRLNERYNEFKAR